MKQSQQGQIRRFSAYFAALAVFATAAPAAADGSVWTAAHIANLTTLRRGGVLGPGAQVGGTLGLGQFFALTADVAASHHFPNAEDEIPGDRVFSGSLGIRYNFDVFKYVPYAGLAGAFYVDAPLVSETPAQPNAGGKLFLGVDWRFHRHWSFGFHGELHALLTDLSRFPVYTLAGLSFGYHFRL